MNTHVEGILNRFCDPEKGRYGLSLPYVQDGYWYATDGHVMARVPVDITETIDATNQGRKVPKDCNIFFANFPPCLDAAPDVGRTLKQCAHCCGSGDYICDCGHEHKCKWCEGKGVVPAFVEWNGCNWKAISLALVKSLPGVKVAYDNKTCRLYFTAEYGIEGVVAPSYIG